MSRSAPKFIWRVTDKIKHINSAFTVGPTCHYSEQQNILRNYPQNFNMENPLE